jgi:hypothetical protein
MSDDPRPIEVSVRDQSTSGEVVGLEFTPFRVRLIAACEGAFARLEAKSGPTHNIFAETGEVLFWLYAISNFDGDPPTIAPSFRWARDNYGHGNLLHELHYTDRGAMLPFVLGKTRLGALPVHCWIAVNVVRPGIRERHPERLAAYNRYIAGQPVITTLRAEFTRVICGDPLPAGYADFEGMTAKDFDP